MCRAPTYPFSICLPCRRLTPPPTANPQPQSSPSSHFHSIAGHNPHRMRTHNGHSKRLILNRLPPFVLKRARFGSTRGNRQASCSWALQHSGCPADPQISTASAPYPVSNTTHRDATAARVPHPGPFSWPPHWSICWLLRQQQPVVATVSLRPRCTIPSPQSSNTEGAHCCAAATTAAAATPEHSCGQGRR